MFIYIGIVIIYIYMCVYIADKKVSTASIIWIKLKLLFTFTTINSIFLFKFTYSYIPCVPSWRWEIPDFWIMQGLLTSPVLLFIHFTKNVAIVGLYVWPGLCFASFYDKKYTFILSQHFLSLKNLTSNKQITQ